MDLKATNISTEKYGKYITRLAWLFARVSLLQLLWSIQGRLPDNSYRSSISTPRISQMLRVCTLSNPPWIHSPNVLTQSVQSDGSYTPRFYWNYRSTTLDLYNQSQLQSHRNLSLQRRVRRVQCYNCTQRIWAFTNSEGLGIVCHRRAHIAAA